MTIIEEVFGKGIKYKELNKEQLYKLNQYYHKLRLDKLTTEERTLLNRKNAAHFRDNHREKYREYQREYRRKRRENDPEFRARTDNHSQKSRTKANLDIK